MAPSPEVRRGLRKATDMVVTYQNEQGGWRYLPGVEDSDISITASMSGTEVRLPRDVLIEGVATDRVGFQPESETKLPTLRFTVSNERGEIEFID